MKLVTSSGERHGLQLATCAFTHDSIQACSKIASNAIKLLRRLFEPYSGVDFIAFPYPFSSEINQYFMLGKHLNFSLSRDKDAEKPIALVDNMATGSDLCQKVCEDITQFYVTLANEPSLAYFRIQEHIRKITPSLSNERSKIVQVNSELQGCCFDVDYSI
ncbi:hypothetical protein CRM22_008048, partial [Opisthorchis felineus]